MKNQLATRREAAARAWIAQHGNLTGATVYGSFSRPFSLIWARAEDVQRATLGHPDNGGTHETPHTYLICQEPLTPESVYNYELTLIIEAGPTPANFTKPDED